MQEVVRKEKEGFESLMRRFNRKVQQSGVLIIAKNKQFVEKRPSKREQRETAIRKNAIKEKKARELLRGF